jgi:hypothetical protein
MGYATSRDDEMEDWERELNRPDGYPIIATGICLLVIFAIAVTQGLSERSLTLGTGMLVATGSALVLWIIAWFVTIRHTTLGWKLGSLAIIWLCAMLASVWAVRSANTALHYDATMLDEVAWRGGMAVLPEHPDRGLLSRAAIKLVDALNAEAKKENALRGSLQAEALGNVDALERQPSLLADCDRFPRAKSAVAAGRQRALDAFKSFRADVDASAIQPAFKQSFMKDVDRALAGIRDGLATVPGLVNEQLDLTGQACTILARHHWRAQAPSIMMNGRRFEIGAKNIAFTDTGDMQAYNAIARRSQKVSEEMRQFEASHRPVQRTPE